MQKMPAPLRFLEPMECKAVDALPNGEHWQYELKLDGYRVIAIKQHGDVEIFSRNGKDFNSRFPTLVDAVAELRPKSFVLDGEVVALDEQGRHSFSLLQNIRSAHAQIQLFVFDLLHLDGKDLTRKPLNERRAVLEREFRVLPNSIRLSPILHGDAEVILEKVREFEFEGAIAKRTDSIYVPAQAPGTWLKHKTQRSDDFVVGGYIPGRYGLDELVVGRRDGKRLLYVESVKNGFVPATRRQVFNAVQKLEIDECPFANLPERKGAHRMDREKMKEVKWVRPEVIVEIAFNEMTVNGHLRHSRFLRLRDDARQKR